MCKDDVQLLWILVGGLVITFAILAAVILPLVYLDGSAKSRWIKETRGIDMPWYEAMALHVEINSIDAEISPKKVLDAD